MGVIKGSNTLLGQKLANTCSFVGGRIIVQQEKSQEQKSYSLGDVQRLCCHSDAIRQSFFTKSVALFTSV
jgi:hypothetical protein